MLNRSPLITNLLQRHAQNMDFFVNGNTCTKYYLLVDGIYLLNGTSLYKQIMIHKEVKCNIFLKCKNELRKMWSVVLGCFECTLQSFRIQADNGTWPQSKVFSYVILHNLIIEDESNCNLTPLFDVGSNVSHLGNNANWKKINWYVQKIWSTPTS
jgi:hypothetical protein